MAFDRFLLLYSRYFRNPGVRAAGQFILGQAPIKHECHLLIDMETEN